MGLRDFSKIFWASFGRFSHLYAKTILNKDRHNNTVKVADVNGMVHVHEISEELKNRFYVTISCLYDPPCLSDLYRVI